MAELIKGVVSAKRITNELREQISGFSRQPKLAIVRVGEKPEDLSYENGARKRMEKCNIRTEVYAYPADITEEEFLMQFDRINEDPEVDGILVFQPLPKSLGNLNLSERIDPKKDVDCISPVNMEGVFTGKDVVYPCTAQAVMEMIHDLGISVSGKRAAVIGRSLVVGKPVAMMLLSENATVTVCHSRTENLPEVVKEADLVVCCIGRGNMIDASYIKEGAYVFDVGINGLPGGGITGDCNLESVMTKAQAVTPVPGGVGSVTTAVLAKHVVQCYQMRMGE